MRIASIVLMCLAVLCTLGPMFGSGPPAARDFLLVALFAVPAIVLSNLARAETGPSKRQAAA